MAVVVYPQATGTRKGFTADGAYVPVLRLLMLLLLLLLLLLLRSLLLLCLCLCVIWRR